MRGEALAVLAWMSWWRSDGGARARLLVDLALADQPDHRLAGLLAVVLAEGLPPPWVVQSA
jgi:hypothetical protein